ncbi:microneme protein mic16 [Cystoisospora suis]|uniref:Microneme protein mic16 n=1 Tax=Cystoisospora suis TaxID=483139 RepID=A0A2C6L429_9APIC|nr:microneme protein mic16 [Cystoisospora suis]
MGDTLFLHVGPGHKRAWDRKYFAAGNRLRGYLQHEPRTFSASLLCFFSFTAVLSVNHLLWGVESLSRTSFSSLISDASRFHLPDSETPGVSELGLLEQDAEVLVPPDRLSGFRTSSADFEKSFQYGKQASSKEAVNLLSMQRNECPGVYWGKKELVSRIGSNILKSALYMGCRESKFRFESRPRTKTWRECAKSASTPWQFFSWVQNAGDADGACIVLMPSQGEVTQQDMEDCLREANSSKQQIAVTGVFGDHSSCTSCQVGDWNDLACDSWCSDGLKGRFRWISGHASPKHCEAQSDANCDTCPNLWDVQPCNTGTSCATGIRPGVRACPTASGRTLEQVKTWRECNDLCLEGFRSSGGAISDPGTFYKTDCFKYAFNNETASCVFSSLHNCSGADLVEDPVWISADVLSQPAANYTTVTWGEWQEWSSCEMVDPAEGWKKRTRAIRKWGFRGDNDWAAADWITAEPCSANATLSKNLLDMAMNPANMCAVYGEFAEWASVPCVPSCGANRRKTRSRKLLQMPVKLPSGSFLQSCPALDTIAPTSQQTKECPGVVTCNSPPLVGVLSQGHRQHGLEQAIRFNALLTGDSGNGGCVYSEWTSWSDCRCGSNQSGIARELRARSLLSGDASTCKNLEEQRKCENAECRSETNVYYVGAAVGIAVLALVSVFAYKFSRRVPAAAPQREHM